MHMKNEWKWANVFPVLQRGSSDDLRYRLSRLQVWEKAHKKANEEMLCLRPCWTMHRLDWKHIVYNCGFPNLVGSGFQNCSSSCFILGSPPTPVGCNISSSACLWCGYFVQSHVWCQCRRTEDLFNGHSITNKTEMICGLKRGLVVSFLPRVSGEQSYRCPELARDCWNADI